MGESEENRNKIRQERESKELITRLEKEKGNNLYEATRKFLTGYRHIAEETGYSTDVGIHTAYIHANEHKIKGEVFGPTSSWNADTNLLGSWRIDIGTTQGSPSLLSEKPTEYIVTLRHIPPDKTEADPKAFIVEFAVSAGKVSDLNIHHPLTRPGHEIKVERSQTTTVEYAIHTLNQLGDHLSKYKKIADPLPD